VSDNGEVALRHIIRKLAVRSKPGVEGQNPAKGNSRAKNRNSDTSDPFQQCNIRRRREGELGQKKAIFRPLPARMFDWEDSNIFINSNTGGCCLTRKSLHLAFSSFLSGRGFHISLKRNPYIMFF
jgi:hypothetical protein